MDEGITITDSGTMFAGNDATRLFQAITLRSALKLHKVGLKINRRTTSRQLLDLAEHYTGKKYKRGEFDRAMADVTIWINVMKSAIPVTVERTDGKGYNDLPIYVNGKEMLQ